jgi:uncharacterized protein (TIGR03066 family)
MKLSSQLAQLRQERKARQAAARPVRPQGGNVSRWRWALIAGGLLLAGGGTWAVLENFVWLKVPAALVGTWEVSEGAMARGTFAFARDGTVAIHADAGGTDYIVTGRATVDGKTLSMTSRDTRTRREQTRTSTIHELTATTLVLELENGQVLRMVRRE